MDLLEDFNNELELINFLNSIPITHDNINNILNVENTKISRFTLAVQYGLTYQVVEMIKYTNLDINYQVSESGITSLHLAIKHKNMVKILLQHHNINVNIKNWKGETPFLRCCKYYKLEKAAQENFYVFLSDERVDINQPNKFNISPLVAIILYCPLGVFIDFIQNSRVKVWENKGGNIIKFYPNIKKVHTRNDIIRYYIDLIFQALRRDIFWCLISPRCIPRLGGEIIRLLPPELVRLMVTFLY